MSEDSPAQLALQFAIVRPLAKDHIELKKIL